VKFEIRDHNDLMRKVIPHFEKFPLISAKYNDFIIFKKICNIVNSAEHLTKTGFIKVINLAYRMNGAGKRKRTKEELIDSLEIKI
jgi:LAGLIDADG endonuclease